MIRPLLTLLVVAMLVLLPATSAHAVFTGARGTPQQTTVVAGRTTVIPVTWQVLTDPTHLEGAASAQGSVFDPSGRGALLTINNTFNAAGAGPFTFRETLNLDPTTVRSWLDLGISRVVYTRTFSDAAGNSVQASITLRLNASRLQSARDGAPGALSVTSLRVEFPSGNNAAALGIDETLSALLTVSYTGTGILRGRWQIAEPESPGEIPLYRTLSLVNKNLTASQRSVLRSPPLPTGRSGRYFLRFCAVDGQGQEPVLDTECPRDDLVTVATYFVQGRSAAVELIRNLSPNRREAGPRTPFSFSSHSGAHIYQLQVFELAPADAALPGSREDSDSVEPRFVTGMLLESGTNETVLSDLARSKLQQGRRYLWRVTAHDNSGRLIGKSAEATFIYVSAE